MNCIYCTSSIEQDHPGYGYFIELNKDLNYIRKYWHSECIEIWEGVAVA